MSCFRDARPSGAWWGGSSLGVLSKLVECGGADSSRPVGSALHEGIPCANTASGRLFEENTMKARWSSLSIAALIILGTGRAQGDQDQGGKVQDVEALVRRIGCLECHSVNKAVIGPAFQDIAARYKADMSQYHLDLMSVDKTGQVPEKRRSAVVVAR